MRDGSLTSGGHVHELDCELLVGLLVGGEVDGAEATLTNLF